ncbi:MAG: DegV family protein [Lachnospiraceae bacterium]|nr:DegV family protein [Lachnospiraceae bacterium]
MANYIISCCSTADLSREHFDRRDIHYVCFHFSLDDISYPDDLGQSINFDEFYQKMAEGAMTKTSQVNVDEFVEYFRPYLEQGLDIFHVTLSSGITGTFNSANIAKDMLKEEYPDRKIYIVDSLAASAGYGLLMDAVADRRDEGYSIDELNAWVLDNRLLDNHWFFSTTLTYFIRGGRISKTAGTIGNMLNICPLMNVDFEGKLIVREKIRSKRKVIKAIVDKMETLARDGLDYNGKCFISNSGCIEDAKAVAELIEERFPNIDGGVKIYNIGTVIGSHTGPGTVALFFWGSKRLD